MHVYQAKNRTVNQEIIMRNYLFLSGILFLTSCNIYNSEFECRPGKGVGCAPVGEVLDLIVEKEKGEDIFAKDKGTALLLKEQEEKDLRFLASKKKKAYLVQDPSGTILLVEEPMGEEK